MKILIKGGIWKNTEDEILKAAVMKYGKNQWARAASLLNRKSAKQCKARWYEWLDPSIKKIEWSREEEEKLLHLAKLMPNQWRTIAPIVGRTAGQCMEHYEKLLDQAQEGSSASSESSEDPRRLRPGEIDPTPETKPARPDPIDMDEDEKEMLSEARARLANTKGKKAKRKARERQLDESKRLAMLQKRRELKAAGIESKLGTRKRSQGIDYGKEIPFQKVPPAGFYDVSEENREAKKNVLSSNERVLEIAKLEGKRAREEQEHERNQDRKKLKFMMEENPEKVIAKISEENDPSAIRRRSMLQLPKPQVTDEELEEIVKVGTNTLMPPPVGGLKGKQSTQMLIGDYSAAAKPVATPLRTPLQENQLMQEARNLLSLRSIVPLADGEKDEALPEIKGGFGFAGATPRTQAMATPNILAANAQATITAATPMRNPGSTPMIGYGGPGSVIGGSSVGGHLKTPLRDQFGLNDQHFDVFSDLGSISSRAMKSQQTSLRNALSEQLKSLPEPEYSYEISMPTVQDVDENDSMDIVEDAADVDARMIAERKAQELLELNRRSSVVKRNLPRPYITSAISSDITSKARDDADLLIRQEMMKMMVYDQYRYPDINYKPVNVSDEEVHELEALPDDSLATASALIEEESNKSLAAASLDIKSLTDQYITAAEEFHKQAMFLPTRGPHGAYDIPQNKTEMLSALATLFNALKNRIEKDNKKSSKLESKLQITTQGYLKRAQSLCESIRSSHAELSQVSTELDCYSRLLQIESRVIPSRMEKAKKEMVDAERREMDLQVRYAKLMELSSR